MDDIVDIKKFPYETVKESEKVTTPLVQNTVESFSELFIKYFK